MTRNLPPVPNHQLKQERLARGWSQRLFVQQIDQQAIRMGYPSALPDLRTIRRWESGQSRPSPFYQTILCALLGKEPEELGLRPAAPAPVPSMGSQVCPSSFSEHTCLLLIADEQRPLVALSVGRTSLVPCYLAVFPAPVKEPSP